MSPPQLEMDLKLSDLAYRVADEYREGKLDRLKGKSWPDTWNNLINELEKRYPGHTKNQYGIALDEGFTASR